MMDKSLLMDSVVSAARGQVSTELGGETVILNMTRGIYFGLDGVGEFVWGLLREPRTIGEIRDRVLDEYDVDPGPCEEDLLVLMHELRASDLIEVVSGSKR